MGLPLEVETGDLLRPRGLTLATAESCTGGLIGHRLTNVPGSSDYYLGGVTAYANEAKVRLLGVRPETLAEFGAVSQETVLEMARGVRQALGASIGLSVSGIAGPGGGSPEKPVGLVWIGLSTDGNELARQTFWSDDRLQVKEQAAEAALALLVEYMKGLSMDAIDVTAHFSTKGEITPLRFTWKEVDYLIEDTGRAWQDEEGRHMLVMVPGSQVFELILALPALRWTLKTVGINPGRATV
jgi:nicotinamide-nucleotide amidase